MGCCLWGHTESGMTEVTKQQYYEIVSAYTAVKMGKDEFQKMSLSNATIK